MNSEQQEQSNTTACAQKGVKPGWELLSMSPSSLNRLCDALDLGFSACLTL